MGNWLYRAEAALAARGQLEAYAMELVSALCPEWQRIHGGAGVLAFWFSLAHAPAPLRAKIMTQVAARTDSPD